MPTGQYCAHIHAVSFITAAAYLVYLKYFSCPPGPNLASDMVDQDADVVNGHAPKTLTPIPDQLKEIPEIVPCKRTDSAIEIRGIFGKMVRDRRDQGSERKTGPCAGNLFAFGGHLFEKLQVPLGKFPWHTTTL